MNKNCLSNSCKKNKEIKQKRKEKKTHTETGVQKVHQKWYAKYVQ